MTTPNPDGPDSTDATVIDTRGLSCPLPVLKAKKAIRGVGSGTLVEVLASDPGSVVDFETFCEVAGHALVEQRHGDGEFRFLLRRK